MRLRLALLAAFATLALAPAASADLRVSGNHLVGGPGAGHTVRLLGVNRSGAEYTCVQGYGIFDGPSSAKSIRAMKRWHINAVRLPLNPDCWLDINGVKPQYAGASYRQAIAAYVQRLEAAGLYVILDLHVDAPGAEQALHIIPLPDADHGPEFWRSVASYFAADHQLIFDLYNEPHDIDWGCWLGGCEVPAGQGSEMTSHPYQAAGMQQLVDAVRSTGATQPLMLGGIDYSRDLGGWLAQMPHDPLGQLVASEHNYGQHLAPCRRGCRATIATVARQVPVVVGELGETDCRHSYIDPFMRWADRHGISYLGWTWDAVEPGGWSCRGGPSLIKNYAGKPTGFGIGFRDHLRALARAG